jgi:hypothetical protein
MGKKYAIYLLCPAFSRLHTCTYMQRVINIPLEPKYLQLINIFTVHREENEIR